MSAARALADRGVDVVLYDKGRRPGGRVSVRRHDDFVFDHGAQFFTARDPAFRAHVERWREAGLVAPWHPRRAVFGTLREPGDPEAVHPPSEWIVGVPGMSALATALGSGLTIRSGVRIEHLRRKSDAWQLISEDGVADHVDAVLVTTPPGQALPLVSASPRLAELAARARMRPCWAVMLGFATSLDVEFDAAFIGDGPLAWAARSSSKPGRTGGDAWVFHASPRWTAEHLEADPIDVRLALTRAFAESCRTGRLPEVLHGDAHRWRYALPDPVPADTTAFDAELGLGVGGDWCVAGRVEGAFTSGLGLARRAIAALTAAGS